MSLALSRRGFLAAGLSAGGAAGLYGLGGLSAVIAADQPKAQDKKRPIEQVVFERLLAKHQDMTYEQFYAKAYTDRKYLTKLSFDPTTAKHFGRVAEQMQMTKEERAIFEKTGFVSIDQKRRHTFGSAYFQIYSHDLPVLITTDSIMHALHRSYDDILIQMELTLFRPTIMQILAECHAELEKQAGRNTDAALKDHYRDVDLYLTVARNLLAGAGAPDKDPEAQPNAPPAFKDAWDGKLLIESKLDANTEALARIKDVQSLKIQVPFQDKPTEIYGGVRFMDYSQFKPRGHYTKNTELKRYFRGMMWLGRVDCGWNVLPTDGTPGVKSDSDRELRDAALLVELLRTTENLKPLQGLDEIINFMVGRSDNLTVFGLQDLLKETKTTTLADLRDEPALKRLRETLQKSGKAKQMIRSQAVISDQNDPYYKVPPPATFQMFGQRYIIDSFVLSQVVFDSIIFQNRKQKRMMPAGLDVMAALGNQEAIPLLKPELQEFKYSANLMASREYVDLHTPEFWKDNLYNLWLDCLRTLDDDLSAEKNFPEAMRTKAWQMKQLQTQLGSWAELRHDTILYAKQSYTAVPMCEYPAGYVEPYPEFYARVKFFAEDAKRRFTAADFSGKNKVPNQAVTMLQQQCVAFFTRMAVIIGKLETLARKELKGEPFTAEENTFLKKTVDMRGGGSGPPRYDGWFCELFTEASQAAKWDPTVADVHTDPESRSCLEVAVGDVNFGVIAIDNGTDRMVFVGPLFSYYEFRQPAEKRLTDPEWQTMISGDKTPPRPDWVAEFQAPPAVRVPAVLQPKRE